MDYSTPPIPLTAEGLAKLQAEFNRLQAEREPVIERLKVAREMGDLSENGAYRYAKFELGNIRRRLNEIRPLLQFGKVVTPPKNPNKVEFGTTVILDLNGKKVSYLLVSKYESNPTEGRLSFESPLGLQLLDKKVGDVLNVTSPGGEQRYTIKSITA